MSQEPLSSFVCDLQKVDTSKPCPIAGDYVLLFEKVEARQTDKGPGAIFSFRTTGPCQCVPDSSGNSRTLPAGWPISHWQNLYQGDNPSQPDWKVQLALIFDAIAGTNNDTRPLNFPALFESFYGKTVQVSGKPRESNVGLVWDCKKFSQPPSV